MKTKAKNDVSETKLAESGKKKKRKEFKPSRTSNLKLRANGCYYGVAKQRVGVEEIEVNGVKKLVTKWRIRKKSFGKCTLEDAQEQLREFLADVHDYAFEPRLDPENPERINKTMETILDEFEKSEMERKNIGDKMQLFIKNRLRFIRNKWQDILHQLPDTISSNDIDKWRTKLEKEDYSAATIRGSLQILKQVFDFADVFTNPLGEYELPTPRQKRGEQFNLSEAGFDRILAEMRRLGSNCAKGADLAELLAATGTRITECVGDDKAPGLRWRDVDWERGELTVRTGKRHHGKEELRVIPFHPRLESILKRLKGDRKLDLDSRISPSMVARRSLAGACKRLRSGPWPECPEKIGHHDIRHLFITWCSQSGIDIPTIADLAGHRDGGALLLRTYRHKQTEHLHQQISKLARRAVLQPAVAGAGKD